jgi:hypothetical protein
VIIVVNVVLLVLCIVVMVAYCHIKVSILNNKYSYPHFCSVLLYSIIFLFSEFMTIYFMSIHKTHRHVIAKRCRRYAQRVL